MNTSRMLKKGRGGWDDPNCARPTRGVRDRALREHGDRPSHPLVSDSSLRPCLGQGASQGEESVLADSVRVGEKSGLFEHPAGMFSSCLRRIDY